MQSLLASLVAEGVPPPIIYLIAMSSLISSVCWVQRGVAARTPKKYTLDEGELDRVSKLAMLRLDDARMQLAIAQEPDAEEGEWEE